MNSPTATIIVSKITMGHAMGARHRRGVVTGDTGGVVTQGVGIGRRAGL